MVPAKTADKFSALGAGESVCEQHIYETLAIDKGQATSFAGGTLGTKGVKAGLASVAGISVHPIYPGDPCLKSHGPGTEVASQFKKVRLSPMGQVTGTLSLGALTAVKPIAQ